MKLNERLKEIENRSEAATEGPWEFNVALLKESRIYQTSTDDLLWLKTDDCRERGNISYDTEFIAHSRTDIPKLTQALRRAVEGFRKIDEGKSGRFNARKALVDIERILNESI